MRSGERVGDRFEIEVLTGAGSMGKGYRALAWAGALDMAPQLKQGSAI